MLFTSDKILKSMNFRSLRPLLTPCSLYVEASSKLELSQPPSTLINYCDKRILNRSYISDWTMKYQQNSA